MGEGLHGRLWAVAAPQGRHRGCGCNLDVSNPARQHSSAHIASARHTAALNGNTSARCAHVRTCVCVCVCVLCVCVYVCVCHQFTVLRRKK